MVQIWEAKSIEKSLLGRLKRFKPVGVVSVQCESLGRLQKVPWLLTQRGDPRARCGTHAGFIWAFKTQVCAV